MTIFLDIDGVLNQLQTWRIDENCVKNLGTLCGKLDAKVVLVSSWRFGYIRDDERKCSPQIRLLLEYFKLYGIVVEGRTKDFLDRSKEVLEYIKTHEVSNYIILDDDKSLYKGLNSNLYIVDYRKGLTQKDVKNILKRF